MAFQPGFYEVKEGETSPKVVSDSRHEIIRLWEEQGFGPAATHGLRKIIQFFRREAEDAS